MIRRRKYSSDSTTLITTATPKTSSLSSRSSWLRTQPPNPQIPEQVTLRHLLPGRRYAMYVEADVLPSFLHGNYDSMHGARSSILYCSTLSVGE